MALGRYRFDVDFLARSQGISRQRFLRALRQNGRDPEQALIALGESPAAAAILALEAGLLGPGGAGDTRSELLRRAQAGELRRGNTIPGTAARRAVDRAEYLRRRAAAPDRSAREALGHRPPEATVPTITALVDLPGGIGYVQLEGLRRLERQRIGRHDSLIRQLDRGQISPAAFRRRVRRWAPVGGYQLASDPAAILAAVDARRQAGEPLGPYPEGGT